MEYNVYESFVESLRTNKVKAVTAFYDAGYITEDEAKGLMNNDWVDRNECTKLFISESTDAIHLTCYETDFIESKESTSILFNLSYIKDSGIILLSDKSFAYAHN